MDKRTPFPMTPFDSLTSSRELQMLKLLLPYTPPFAQRMLAFFIKFTELKNTVRYFGIFSSAPAREEFAGTDLSFPEILEDLKPYMGKDAETIDTILSAMSMMEMMQDMDMSGTAPADMQQMDMGNMADIMNMMEMFRHPPGSGGEDTPADKAKQESKEGMDDDGTGMDESSGNGEH